MVDRGMAEQLGLPTPCSEWDVQALLDHLVGGTEYLLASMDGRPPMPPTGTTAADYRAGVEAVMNGLGRPGVLERTCRSPLGFEWPVGQAVAGTFMDVLIHTWDLARATGQDTNLDPALVEACVGMFFPEMPERGREAGIVGPAVTVGPDASPQAQMLGAMGRTP
ncbi:MAG TPA: TIGR03086 family metal-binding protein [Acidimicrobiales bacterium]|nr:TIGR03086 family metal-binding protein [Acidimicrobiales bacterium]